MNFNYPDFLNQSDVDKFKLPPNSTKNFDGNKGGDGSSSNPGQNSKFNDILFNKLSSLEQSQYPEKSPHSMDSIDPHKSPMGALGVGGIGVGPAGVGTAGVGSAGLGRGSVGDINGQLPLTSPLVNPFSPQIQPFPHDLFYNRLDTFNLPSELQGGVGTINSRRPSYAAESFTRSMDPFANQFQPQLPQQQPQQSQTNQNQTQTNQTQANQKNINLAQFASMNNYSINQLTDGFSNFNLNSNFNDFQSRRPSQLVDFDFNGSFNGVGNYNINNYPGQIQPSMGLNPPPAPNAATTPAQGTGVKSGMTKQTLNEDPNCVKLENGLMLKNQYIMASTDLKLLVDKTTKYFQDPELVASILSSIKKLLENKKILKLITFIKNLNNLTFNHKILCLVINKNGKFDLLSYPNNSNIHLQKGDLVIVDGDRGKDLVMILEPFIDLNFAILFNFLKKIEHLKSLNIVDDNVNSKKFGGTHSTDLNASYIVNNHSNEDNEFMITLPTKQVLRFATPREIHKIAGKFLEEKKAFITCYNKIKELKLENNLQLINVEYQSDFKKLIFYYYANFQRIDFRGLIKELFKIYKTRIWLCAVLPYDNASSLTKPRNLPPLKNSIPQEYNLNNEQIVNFSINELDNVSVPNYFHSVNLNNLIGLVNDQLKGNFYGFEEK